MTINSDHAVLAKSEENIVIGQNTSKVSDEERKPRDDEIKPTKPKLFHGELDDEVAASKPEEEEPVADTEEGSYVSPDPLQPEGGYVSPGRLQLVDREVHVAGEEASSSP